ncbi:MAG: MupG family TIM beta-alpha barrel fold protein [Bacillus sp. (in: firmicutes)]
MGLLMAGNFGTRQARERDDRMIGLSIYLGKLDEQAQFTYLRKMRDAGFTTIFTSMNMILDDKEDIKEQLLKLSEQVKSLKMDIMVDASPASMAYLGKGRADQIEWIKKQRNIGVRVDYGMKADEIAEISQCVNISLNASTLNEPFIESLIAEGLNFERTEAWHNYYPRKETGLSRQAFKKRNHLIRSYGIVVSAFAPGDGELREPLYETLPTVEVHRGISPFISYLDLLDCYVNKVIIGDVSLREETIAQFRDYKKGSLPIRCRLYNDSDLVSNIVLMQHRNRLDAAEFVIRSETSRTAVRKNRKISCCHTTERKKGTITVDNEEYGRYCGELQIPLVDLPPDGRVNVVGEVIEEDLPLIAYIKEGTNFHFIKAE